MKILLHVTIKFNIHENVECKVVHKRFTPARLPSVTNLAKPTVDHVRETLWADTVSVLSFIEKEG